MAILQKFILLFGVALTAPIFSVLSAWGISTGIVVQHDVVFGKGGNRDLHAEVAYPKNITHPLPAILFIHGGGWSAGSHKGAPIEGIANAGYFAASIEYRLSSEAKWPAQIEDCKLAVRWLRANAERYHVAPDRIGVWGGSAGGHLAVCLGTMADAKELEGTGGYPGVSSAVQAVADFSGPVDFTDLTREDYSPKSLGIIGSFLGASYEQNPAIWKNASPLSFVKAGDPPMLIVHGDADDLVPLKEATSLDDALTKVGVPHHLIIVKNGTHGLTPSPDTTSSPSPPEIIQAVVLFFAQYLGASQK